MKKGVNITALIPARGGSKGIPSKNIIEVEGFPLIAYSIAAAKLSKVIDRIVVSTDSPKIADIAVKYGAEVPFLRPKKYATDKSPDIEFVKHATDWFIENEGNAPKYFVHLRPTTPLRKPANIDKAVRLLFKNSRATALRSVHEIRESPYKLFKMEKGYLRGLFPDDPRPEYYNLPRQSFPPVYQPNGYVDILISKQVLSGKGLHGGRVLGFVTEDSGEIDKKQDVEIVDYLLKKHKYDEILEYLKNNF